MRTAPKRYVFSVVLAVVAVTPHAAWAVQSHGGAEGLVAHEIGHVLFSAGLLYVLLAGGARRWGASGRRAYRSFLVLAVVWNVLAFTGHFLAESVHVTQVVRGPTGIESLVVRDAWDWLYYLTVLDHVVLVPALALLLLALLRWWRSEDEAS